MEDILIVNVCNLTFEWFGEGAFQKKFLHLVFTGTNSFSAFAVNELRLNENVKSSYDFLSFGLS